MGWDSGCAAGKIFFLEFVVKSANPTLDSICDLLQSCSHCGLRLHIHKMGLIHSVSVLNTLKAWTSLAGTALGSGQLRRRPQWVGKGGTEL